MTGNKQSFFTAAGSLALAIGITVHLGTHGNFSHFVTGLLLGMALAFLWYGRTQSRNRISG